MTARTPPRRVVISAALTPDRPMSVACDVRVPELVDGNVGVHVMIPKSILALAGHAARR